MIEKIKRFLGLLFAPVKIRFEFPNGSIDNLGVIEQNAVEYKDVERLMRMVKWLARMAESQRAVRINSTVTDAELNEAMVEALTQGKVMPGQRGYFSVTDQGAQIVLLIPDGGSVEFVFVRGDLG